MNPSIFVNPLAFFSYYSPPTSWPSQSVSVFILCTHCDVHVPQRMNHIMDIGPLSFSFFSVILHVYHLSHTKNTYIMNCYEHLDCIHIHVP